MKLNCLRCCISWEPGYVEKNYLLKELAKEIVEKIKETSYNGKRSKNTLY